MPFCNKCGTEVPENTNFCPKCGGQQGGGSIVATGEKAAKINKIILAVSCGIGMLAVFLPWVTSPLRSINGIELPEMPEVGWIFLILSFFSLTGASKIKETAKNKMLKDGIICAISLFFGVIRIYYLIKTQHNLKICLVCSWGIGIYLAYLSSITATIMPILMIIDNIKRGKK